MQQELNQAQTGKTSSHTMSGQTMMSDNHSMISDKEQAMSMESKDMGSVLKLSNANLPIVIPSKGIV